MTQTENRETNQKTTTMLTPEALDRFKNSIQASLAVEPGPVSAAFVRVRASRDPVAARNEWTGGQVGAAFMRNVAGAEVQARARYFAEAYPDLLSVEEQRYDGYRDLFLFFPYSPQRVRDVVCKMFGADAIVAFGTPYLDKNGENDPLIVAEAEELERDLVGVEWDAYYANNERVSANGFVFPAYTEAQASAFDALFTTDFSALLR